MLCKGLICREICGLAHFCLNACVRTGLVSLGSENRDGGFGIAYTIANMLVLGGHAEPRHRVRLQQILILPRMHQGESNSRFRKKVHYRRKFLRLFIQKRKEMFAQAWEMSDDNEVRNRWVRLARMALDQQRKHNPSVEKVKVSKTACQVNSYNIKVLLHPDTSAAKITRQSFDTVNIRGVLTNHERAKSKNTA